MTGRLLVVGAVNVDMVVAAPTLPGPGETVVGEDLQRHGGGKGGNAAVAAARSGAEVRFVGAVGNDALGTGALADLRDDAIDVTDVAIKAEAATGAALIVVDADGENQIAVAAGANAAITPGDVDAAFARAEGWPDCVLISTEITAAAVVHAVAAATANGWLCVLNPAPAAPGIREALGQAPILTPNRGELLDVYRLLGGTGAPPVDTAARAVAARTGAPVVVTLGAEGILVCDAFGVTTRIPAQTARAVVDTTGAGDTFNGVFAASLAAGQDLLSAARRGVAAAALSVEAAGARTSMPHAPAIDTALTPADRGQP
ncbi:PfkB family carbohydrate kinase [Pseudodonghicola flavimaris]|uniref:Ribokinase n=1 Tax=Pseudodonghicola flavimaris TaxID=3050036 RepID=A0ABT7EWY4_9RHOB|nr:PfkB family carbohydrate kinase [Pseudodonghicola flavimaris]MDK3016847.1 PfkB family carbohydrate kinase [Pseudodonghicola flavimaris]